MPNIKSAIKRVNVNKKKNEINKSAKSEVKTALKKLNALIAAGDVAACEASFKEVCSILDKSVAKGIMHKNTAARKKSRFTLMLKKIAA